MTNQIKVGLIGLGLLGTRIALSMQRQLDLKLAYSITRLDLSRERSESFETVFNRSPWGDVFIDEDSTATSPPLNDCEVLVQACPSSPWLNRNLGRSCREFSGPVISWERRNYQQSLIAAPFSELNSRNTYAGDPYPAAMKVSQGDCLVSGLAPILSVLKEYGIQKIALSVDRISKSIVGYPTSGAIHDMINISHDVSWEMFLPKMVGGAVSFETIREWPGLNFYNVKLRTSFEQTVEVDSLIANLSQTPRLLLVPNGLASMAKLDEYLVQAACLMGKLCPPIMVYSLAMAENRKVVVLDIAINHYTVTALSVIDAVRILARDMDPIESMCITDRQANLLFPSEPEFSRMRAKTP